MTIKTRYRILKHGDEWYVQETALEEHANYAVEHVTQVAQGTWEAAWEVVFGVRPHIYSHGEFPWRFLRA